MKIINKKAYHNYQILDKLEAGVMLLGAEAKSIRSGRAQMDGAYVKIVGNEVWLINAVIPEYEHSRDEKYKSDRTRKLLLKSNEILKLSQKIQTKGVTLVPLSVYTKKSLIKVEVGLAKGKKQYEKRETIKSRDIQRDSERELKEEK